MIKDGFYYHTCGQKVLKVLPETVLINCVAYCKRCKTEHIINIIRGQEVKIEFVKKGEKYDH